MRTSARRKDVGKLFVLGAGASYAASEVKGARGRNATYEAPLDAHFTKRVADLEFSRPGWVSGARDDALKAWRHESAFTSLGLEEAIIAQLGDLEFFRTFHPRRVRDALSAFQWMNLVSHLICAILRRCRQNRSQLYSRFERWALPVGNDAGHENRILTFNYDTLLDNLLIKRFAVQDLYFDDIQKPKGRRSKHKQEHPILLKLHGSANWRCASDDFRRIVENSSPAEGDLPHHVPDVWIGNDLPDPNGKASPLIIPPIPTKPVSRLSLFRYLWTRAYEYLYEAKELVIVGYSLPQTDQMARSMFRGFRSSKLERIVVVDPSPAVLLRWRSVLN